MALQSMTALKSMSIEKLINLKSDVEAMLAQKVSEQRHSLQQELSKLGGYTGSKKGRSGPRGTVPPKYRHPETGETWSGRGLKPRWLTAAMKSGKSLEAFAITAGKGTRGRPRKAAK
jgi:DNA-binding protein H-NS